MGAIELELRCPKNVDGITVEPEPNWGFDALLSELNSLEQKLSASSPVPVPFTKTQLRREISNRKSVQRSPVGFAMRVSAEEMEDSESEDEEHENSNLNSVKVKRFNCHDLYISDSDDSDREIVLDGQSYLMDEVGLVEGALFELSKEHRLGIEEELRNQISVLETELMSEIEKSTAAFVRVERYKEARREMDRKLDTRYQRRIAEALDNHLTAIQRDHELKSQMEERRIRSDAAYEEAKRKEKALQEERLRQERARAEAEAKLRAEEAKKAAQEAERRAAKEAVEKEAAKASKKITGPVSQEANRQEVNSSPGIPNLQTQGSGSKEVKKPQSAGDVVRAAESALNLEQGRLLKLKELDEKNQLMKSGANMDFSTHERHITRLIRQIRGTKENVRAKASELMKIFMNPSCPQSVSIATFVKKVVSHCESPDNAAFACGHVIVLVTSQVPHAMDLLLAEFHKACIYTVPKHIVYSKTVFESKESYYKTIGFREDAGKVESIQDYLKRVESYMKLYGALTQTEIQGVQNSHGPKEGWAWLARFLNALPANMYTAVALNAFLQAAGFVLFRKYKSQFRKILDIISNDFLKVLREREDPELNPIIMEMQSYIEDKKFLKEPDGRSLQTSLLSTVMVPDAESSRDHYHYY